MKIIYLITKSEFGGAQTHVLDLCRYFKRKGHDILVMSRGGGYLEEECRKMGIKFWENIYFKNSPNLISIFCAINIIKKCVNDFKPDIVHCHSSAAAFLGRMAVRGSVRTIYTAHGWGFNIGVKFWVRYPVLFLEKLCARYTDFYICVSEFVKKLGLRYHLAEEKKFKVIYNGVTYENKIVNVVDLNKIVFVGRLAEPKIPEMIIDAINILPDYLKEKIILTVVGDGPKFAYLKNLSETKKINVVFTGSLSNEAVKNELMKNGIFILLSRWEGLPYSILEAMSVGLPVIASDVGGIKEVVSADNGLLVRNNIEEVSRAILTLINNRDLCLNMSINNRDKISSCFSLEIMCKHVEDVYKQV